MRILYSAGNRVGADILLSRFLFNTKHEIKVAAYIKSSNSINHIDWILDAVYNEYTGCNRRKLINFFGRKNIPMMGWEPMIQLIEDISYFEPDLIICDYEPIISNIAKSIGVPLWYCSPVHLLEGFDWEPGQMKYCGVLENTRKLISKLPEPDKTFVYSPFNLVGGRLRNGYNWLMPYSFIFECEKQNTGVCVTNDSERISELSKILNCIAPFDLTLFSPHKYNMSHLESYLLEEEEKYCQAIGASNWLFCSGETSFITDAIINEINWLCISPDLKDPEAVLNSNLVDVFNIGDDLGQVEYLKKMAVEEISVSYTKKSIKSPTITREIDIKFLGDAINEFCSV